MPRSLLRTLQQSLIFRSQRVSHLPLGIAPRVVSVNFFFPRLPPALFTVLAAIPGPENANAATSTVLGHFALLQPFSFRASALGMMSAIGQTNGNGHAAYSVPAAPPHKLCMIPGPVEFDVDVLAQMSTPAMSHMDPWFQNCFGETIELTREVFKTKTGQPLIVAATGTAGWDITALNFIEPGQNAVVVSTGLFSDRFSECLSAYGANVTTLKARLGKRPSLEEIEAALVSTKPKLITVTHTDTSAGVVWDVQAISQLVRRVSPETLVVVDGVCAVACEELKFDEWDIDIVHTASQKALGCPPGLAVLIFSERAMNVFKARKTPVHSYYFDLNKWLPIMASYEARKAGYFATPAVQLIRALNVGLHQIVGAKGGVDGRIAQHLAASKHVKDALVAMGLRLVPETRDIAANGMTAVWLPDELQLSDVLPRVSQRGVMLAGGLHPEAPTRYFRIGHMNVSVTRNEELGHIAKTLKAVEESLEEVGHKFPTGYKKL